MRSVLQALIWDSLRYAGWAQLILLSACMLLPMAVYLMILPINPDSGSQAGDPVMMLLEVSLMPFVVFLLVMGAAVSFANMAQLHGKPLSNLGITAWRTVGGSILLALQTGAIVAIFNGVLHVGWPLAGAVLFVVALWMVLQPFLCLGGKSFSGFIVTILPIMLMFGWLLTRYKPIGGGNRDWDEISLSETVQLLAIIGIFAWCSLRSVALTRRGDVLSLPSWLGGLGQSILSWPAERDRELKPFRTIDRAMFWYEWRWKGWGLAFAYAIWLSIVLPIVMIDDPSIQNFLEAVTGLYAGMIIPAIIVGVLSGFQLESMQVTLTPGKNSATRLHEADELGSFQATRPVSDAKLAKSKLLVCLSSVLLMAVLWLLIATPALLLAAQQGIIESLPIREKFFIVPLATLIMWIMMSNILALISTGRTKLLGGAIMALLIAFAGVLTLLEWLANPPTKTLVLQTLLVLFTLAASSLTIWAYMRSLRLRYLTKREVSIAAAIVLISLVAGCYQPTVTVTTVSASICAGVFSVLPWAITPLAIGWNRHR